MQDTDEWYDRGYIPHFHAEDSPQTITIRLRDSLPVAAYKRVLAMARNKRERAILVDRMLDQGRGSCILERPPIARIVRDSILHCDGQYYDLKNWVIMPNHVHIDYANGTLSPTELGGKLKGFTSWKIGRKFPELAGPIWQKGTFDRFIRDGAHAFFVQNYFWFNPVRAGLAEHPWNWEWSSIHDSKFDKEVLRRWFERHRDTFWDSWGW